MSVNFTFKRLKAVALGFTLSLAGSYSLAAPMYSDIYVFGDSLSDTGNVQDVVGTFSWLANAAGYGSNGRFSNGNVWHEYLAPLLGLPAATRSRSGGNNYAYGGAVVDNAGAPSAGVLTQTDDYLDSLGTGSADADALYIAWIGGNDVRSASGASDPLAAINASITALQGMLSELIDNGVSTLLVPNLPDLGRIPEFAGTANSAAATGATIAWNTALEAMLRPLAMEGPTDIFYFDVFSVFNELLDDPAAFGFSNVTGQCRSLTNFGFTERECANPSTYLFWDDIHPTTAAHAQLANRAFALLDSGEHLPVPAPQTALLLVMGLLLIRANRKSVSRKLG